MQKNLFIKNALAIVLLLFISPNYAMDDNAAFVKGFKHVCGSIAYTITDSPISCTLAAFTLLYGGSEVIKENPFISAVVATNILDSFTTYALRSIQPKNCLFNTVKEHPFLTGLAVCTLIFNKDEINNNPFLSMYVGGTLAYKLSKNYLKEETA